MNEYEKKLLKTNNLNWFLSYIRQHPRRDISSYLSEVISTSENESCKHALNRFIKTHGSIVNGSKKDSQVLPGKN